MKLEIIEFASELLGYILDYLEFNEKLNFVCTNKSLMKIKYYFHNSLCRKESLEFIITGNYNLIKKFRIENNNLKKFRYDKLILNLSSITIIDHSRINLKKIEERFKNLSNTNEIILGEIFSLINIKNVKKIKNVNKIKLTLEKSTTNVLEIINLLHNNNNTKIIIRKELIYEGNKYMQVIISDKNYMYNNFQIILKDIISNREGVYYFDIDDAEIINYNSNNQNDKYINDQYRYIDCLKSDHRCDYCMTYNDEYEDNSYSTDHNDHEDDDNYEDWRNYYDNTEKECILCGISIPLIGNNLCYYCK